MNATTGAALSDYRNFHLWMLVPFAISILGFSFSYYLNFTNATFHQHVHGLSATAWYALIVVQPYLIVRRRDVRGHRSLGAVATVLAGIVAGSSLAIVPANIGNVADLDPDGFFNPTFAYFAVMIDLVMVSMFVASVVLAIFAMKRRDLAGHVQWMMASVFFVLSPALIRMLGIGAITARQGNMEGISLVTLAAPTWFVMMSLIVFYFCKFGSFRHPAFWFLVVVHVPTLFVQEIGDNPVFRSVISALFKGPI